MPLRNSAAPPAVEIRAGDDNRTVALTGRWDLGGLGAASWRQLEARIESLAADPSLAWDLGAIDRLDRVGALVIMRGWGGRRPARLTLGPDGEALLARWAELPPPPPPRRGAPGWPGELWRRARGAAHDVVEALTLVGGAVLALATVARRRQRFPWRETSAAIYEAGARALGVTALIGLLIGIVISYLSAVQLRQYGAEVYIVDIVGIGVIRELGPLLAAILVAGRSGSAMTAEIAAMRITEELDAMAALGISRTQRLVLPRVVALTLVLPLLVVWTDVIALAGGSIAANLALGMTPRAFFGALPAATPIANLSLGLSKGALFGTTIAVVACLRGLRAAPSTQSLGRETTNSVVASITLVILIDAVFAVLFEGVGTRWALT